MRGNFAPCTRPPCRDAAASPVKPRSALSTSAHAVTMSPLPDPGSISTCRAFRSPAAALTDGSTSRVKKAQAICHGGRVELHARHPHHRTRRGGRWLRPAGELEALHHQVAAGRRGSGLACVGVSDASDECSGWSSRTSPRSPRRPGRPSWPGPGWPLVASTTGRSESSMRADTGVDSVPRAKNHVDPRVHPWLAPSRPTSSLEVRQLWPSHRAPTRGRDVACATPRMVAGHHDRRGSSLVNRPVIMSSSTSKRSVLAPRRHGHLPGVADGPVRKSGPGMPLDLSLR